MRDCFYQNSVLAVNVNISMTFLCPKLEPKFSTHFQNEILLRIKKWEQAKVCRLLAMLVMFLCPSFHKSKPLSSFFYC